MKDCGRNYPGKHLKAALGYICDPQKTGQGRFVGGINCQPEYAYEQMKDTKKEFGKTDKRQGYHLIISFADGEVDAETAFEFTKRFAKEYLGEQFEAVYAVHDNTDHIHSHIVFNSVSFIDGRKYRYEKGDWAKYIQPITNRLCQEYGLSIVEIEPGGAKPSDDYKDWNANRDGSFPWADMVRRDVDACIVQTDTFVAFVRLLKEKGYEVKQNKYLAVKGQGMKRFVRLKTLGGDYTEERIRERIPRENLSTYHVETLDEAEGIVYSQIPYGKRANLSGLQKKYYAKLYRLGMLKRRPYSQAWKYRQEIKEFHKLQEQYLFLIDHRIESINQLVLETEQLTEKKKTISSEKSRIYRARQACSRLFEIQDKMQEYESGEQAYRDGDPFFEEEHSMWCSLEEKLKQEGYSYEELEVLREHYQKEYTRVRMLEREMKKELGIAKSILKEVEEKAREYLEIKEEKKEKGGIYGTEKRSTEHRRNP